MPDQTQFILPFPRRLRFTAEAFCAGPSNQEALAWLERTAEWPDRRLAIWGEAGCGKTHLLHSWAGRTSAALIDASSLHDLPELPDAAGFAIDDADAEGDETALFHLLNAAAEAKLPVLLAARRPPARWPTVLPDLASRLRSFTTVEIGPPDDELLLKLMGQLLASYQLKAPDAVRQWMLRHLPRTPAAMQEAIERLDRAAVERGRAVTRVLAADVLRDLIGPESGEISASPLPPSRQNPAVL